MKDEKNRQNVKLQPPLPRRSFTQQTKWFLFVIGHEAFLMCLWSLEKFYCANIGAARNF